MERRDGIPYNPGTHQLPGCITTSASDNIHYSGTRSYSTRENACFQTFPPHYIFCKPGIAKQIGNALPPAIWTQFLSNCVKALEDFDAGVDNGIFSPYSPSKGTRGPRPPKTNTSSPIVDLRSDDIDDSPLPIKAQLRPKSNPSPSSIRRSTTATLFPSSERFVTISPGQKSEHKPAAAPPDWSEAYEYGKEEGVKKSVTDPRGNRVGKEVIVLD